MVNLAWNGLISDDIADAAYAPLGWIADRNEMFSDVWYGYLELWEFAWSSDDSDSA